MAQTMRMYQVFRYVEAREGQYERAHLHKPRDELAFLDSLSWLWEREGDDREAACGHFAASLGPRSREMVMMRQTVSVGCKGWALDDESGTESKRTIS